MAPDGVESEPWSGLKQDTQKGTPWAVVPQEGQTLLVMLKLLMELKNQDLRFKKSVIWIFF